VETVVGIVWPLRAEAVWHSGGPKEVRCEQEGW